ncbi:unnamed protein product [Hyaloperonospora brassicae]|uniref:Magnesium transporter n=1 Tax=Hyaloperonospora brassicae TaxID=162125 RepID=A0AAV0V2E5_HYABA|nr:unnamed protein product [Hyaloperonospora brassicae]CAI5731957.1 unnamed protein product [Hyaloperonospora brassicae]CAI5742458.1 unnamed protein product [Hyaloperonospora brassicae]
MRSDFIGGAIAILSAFLSIFGVNLQKYSHDKEELRAVPRPYTMRPIWWVGMVCVVAASLGDFLALGFAPQTLVASLGGGSTILGNCLMSHFWLQQSLYVTDIVGVAVVSLGVVVLAAASEGDAGHYEMEQIYELMAAAPFILYALITTAFTMTLYMRARRSKAPALRVASTDKDDARVDDVQEKKRQLAAASSRRDAANQTTTRATTTEPKPALVDDAVALEETKPMRRGAFMSPFPSPIFGDHLSLSPMGTHRLGSDEDDHLEEIELSSCKVGKYDESEIEKQTLIIDPKLPLYWAAISGTIGGQSVLLAKCVVELISSTVSGDNQFLYFGTYVLCLGMAATLLTQTHTLNLATMTGDTMSSYPVFQGFWITMSNISGVVFFQQAHSFTKTQWIMFPTAIALVALGIYLVSKHEKFGHLVKYSIAMPISLSSPRQHDIVAQSFVFRVSTPQKLHEDDYASSTESSSPDEHSRRALEVV